ncbi:4Fe-4S dicluster domain-containing protein [Helicobacter muridarum]|uniref:2-oxoglutarate:acceptor oxidoreductase subunit OorD n=1 Tax=Helicobacter muridarum TaxID=216 RepID=A0A099TZM1_9HELI|nr:4Fe-4S binding protein [Helicobacter muridarum]TLD98481.1 4Fe-4S dicluster domain-containing protein [Helicobacter muridarum]STQ85582.1 2-oxoglutarate:acceptor oxidoreductase subunit OorD [Helicobacter muridarum]
MSEIVMPENVPVWVNEARCKACDICVSRCPAGVLAMQLDSHKVLGKIVMVIHPESCIGCLECELHCPDFAITVADRKKFKFAKTDKAAQARADKIKANKFMAIEEDVSNA